MSPRERSAQIEEAARAVALEGGLVAVTLRGVASRIGVASGLVSHYAPSMDALVASTFSAIVAAEIADVEQLLAAYPSPPGRLLALVDTLLDQSRDDVTVIWVEAWAMGRRNNALAAAVREQMDAWQQVIHGIVEEGVDKGNFREVDPGSIAWQLLGMIDGLNAHALVRWHDRDVRAPHIRSALEGMMGSGSSFA